MPGIDPAQIVRERPEIFDAVASGHCHHKIAKTICIDAWAVSTRKPAFGASAGLWQRSSAGLEASAQRQARMPDATVQLWMHRSTNSGLNLALGSKHFADRLTIGPRVRRQWE
jgi:hypothetical protein